MPTVFDLGQRVKTKYPGEYDDLPDDELGRKVKAKYPGDYDDFTEQLTQPQAGAELDRLSAPAPITPQRRPFRDPLSGPQVDRVDATLRPILGTERLGGLPRVPSPPEPQLPLGERAVQKGIDIFNKPGEGVAQATRGVRGVLSPPERSWTEPPASQSWIGRRREALSDILEGTAQAGTPFLLPAAATAPVITAASLGAGAFTTKYAAGRARAWGAEPETARLIGNVAGFMAAGSVGGGLARAGRPFPTPPSIRQTPIASEVVPEPTPAVPPVEPPVPLQPATAGERGSIRVSRKQLDALRAPTPMPDTYGFISPANEVFARSVPAPQAPGGRTVLAGGHSGIAGQLGMADEFVAQQRGYVRYIFGGDGVLNLSFVDSPRTRARAAAALAGLPEQPSKIHLDLLTGSAGDGESFTFFSLPATLQYLRSGNAVKQVP